MSAFYGTNVPPYRSGPSSMPALCAYSAYKGGPRRRTVRKEPSASIGKRVFDVAVASAALLFLAPLLIAVAIAIKLTSRGPVLFHQYRYGYRNRSFKIYKFRSMRTDLGDARGVKQTVQGNSRVTAVGRILRKTSLDEIPQLINVIKGDMSLVGPRPHVPGMLAAQLPYEHLVPYYFQRHSARPGITGSCAGERLQGQHRRTKSRDLADRL